MVIGTPRSQDSAYNYNIALIRPVLCFGVVCAHCLSGEKTVFIDSAIRCCVPLFFLISFFFFQSHFQKDDIHGILYRFTRLCVPQIGWALIYFFVINLACLLLNKDGFLSIKALLGQIVTGHCYNQTMWFQTDLIIVTAIVYASGQFFKRLSTAFLLLLLFCIIAFILQYSGYNYQLFSPLPYAVSFPLGRVAEMFPFAVCGMALSFFYKRSKWKTLAVTASLAAGFFFLTVGTRIPCGFDYQGIRLFSGAILIFSLLLSVPLEKLPRKALDISCMCSRYTLGIYCSHRLIAPFLKNVLDGLGFGGISGSFVYCVMVYLLCFGFFFVIDRLIKCKYARMLYQ